MTDIIKGNKNEKLQGLLLGAALGDALGLPYENLSRNRASRRLNKKGLRHSFLLGKGLVSDDTELAVFALLAYANEPDPAKAHKKYARSQARWLLTLPAGIGRATLSSSLRLLFGASYKSSGQNSAGNGACARALFLGPITSIETIQENIRITHTDPRAIEGATLIAHLTTPEFQNLPPDQLEPKLLNLTHGEELAKRLKEAFLELKHDQNTDNLLTSWNCENGPTGYINITVPLTVFLWLKHRQDYKAGVTEAIALGGDTDSLAFLVGGLIGLEIGRSNLPQHLISNLIDQPHSPHFLDSLAKAVSEGTPPPKLAWPHYLWRGPLFFITVLTHVILRLVRLN